MNTGRIDVRTHYPTRAITLTEILVCVAVLAILAALLLPREESVTRRGLHTDRAAGRDRGHCHPGHPEPSIQQAIVARECQILLTHFRHKAAMTRHRSRQEMELIQRTISRLCKLDEWIKANSHRDATGWDTKEECMWAILRQQNISRPAT